MPPAVPTAGLVLGAYLLGSVPFALLLGFALGHDIRRTGSGNVGATNLSRAAGRRWGIAAFALDFLKGLAPAATARWAAAARPESFALAPGGLAVAAGLAAILGHVFPVYLAFRGGKGVATTFGVMAALSWASTLAAGAVWAAVYLTTRTVSIGSMAAAVALPVAVACLERGLPDSDYSRILYFAIAVGAVIIIRHRSNLARLLKGEELKFGARRGHDR